MTNRVLYEQIKYLLDLSLRLSNLSKSSEISYEKSVELRQQHEKTYKKWLFYKKLQQSLNK